MHAIIDHGDDHVKSVTIATKTCHPQSAGSHGDYIYYMKQAEQSLHETSLPVVKVQPIRIEGFGSSDLNIQYSKDDKVISKYHDVIIDISSYSNPFLLLKP